MVGKGTSSVKCVVDRCREPMDEFVLVTLEIPPVRFEAVDMDEESYRKVTTTDDDRATFQVYMCVRHGDRVRQLMTHGKRAALPTSTFGPMVQIGD